MVPWSYLKPLDLPWKNGICSHGQEPSPTAPPGSRSIASWSTPAAAWLSRALRRRWASWRPRRSSKWCSAGAASFKGRLGKGSGKTWGSWWKLGCGFLEAKFEFWNFTVCKQHMGPIAIFGERDRHWRPGIVVPLINWSKDSHQVGQVARLLSWGGQDSMLQLHPMDGFIQFVRI